MNFSFLLIFQQQKIEAVIPPCTKVLGQNDQLQTDSLQKKYEITVVLEGSKTFKFFVLKGAKIGEGPLLWLVALVKCDTQHN